MLNARGSQLQLTLGLFVSFYGVQTVVGQIEALFFLTPLAESFGAGSIPAIQMPLKFIRAQFIIWAFVALTGILSARLLMKQNDQKSPKPVKIFPNYSFIHWLYRILIIIITYELLYFSFGYFIAWQNPDILEFYQGKDPGSFFLQMKYVFTKTPGLLALQAFRSLLWMLFLLPVIRMVAHKNITGSLIVGFYAALPLTIPNLIPNPFMPEEVRIIHFVETVTSTFIFGVIVFRVFRKPINQNYIKHQSKLL